MDLAHHHFPTIDSTNDYAKLHASELDLSGLTVISSDEQTKGRGRGDHHWCSPSGMNAYLTFCCFAPQDFPSFHNCAQFLSLVYCEVLHDLQIPARLKWPNDILIHGKKAAGVLCELLRQDSHVLVINGIGININMDASELKKIPGNPTSLFYETRQLFQISGIIQRLIKAYRSHLDQFLREGFAPFLSRYEAVIAHQPDEPILFHVGEQLEEGRFHSIADNGSLNLISKSGEIKNFFCSL